MDGEGKVSLGGLYGPNDAFPIAMGVGWGRQSLGLLRIGRMVTLEPHLYLKVHCHPCMSVGKSSGHTLQLNHLQEQPRHAQCWVDKGAIERLYSDIH